MSHPKNRKEASQQGLKTYFTGKPCKRGGVAFRKLNGDCLCDVCKDVRRVKSAESARNHTETRDSWKLLNKDKVRASQKKYEEKNKGAIKQRLKDWKKANPERVFADFHKRRGTKINATPNWYGEFDALVMHEAMRLAQLRESLTGMKWHIDHMIPLQATTASGLHCAANIQVIPQSMNVKKRNEMIYTTRNEWLAHV